MSKSIWRVEVQDAAYSLHDTFLLRGKSAGVVEKLALKKFKERDKDLLSKERRHRPYIQSIEFVGDLDN